MLQSNEVSRVKVICNLFFEFRVNKRVFKFQREDHILPFYFHLCQLPQVFLFKVSFLCLMRDPFLALILKWRGRKSVAAGRQAASRETYVPWRASAVSRPKECSGASRATRWLLGRWLLGR
ncbi:hypothetical protein BHE74_00001135 [Ensete ventricosum]|nr:hypothetical protein GW17_00010987 [Ensete ventricosum]RWW89822.1 hypothetical protein BHE74_00001135 [Ensete ventricosum]